MDVPILKPKGFVLDSLDKIRNLKKRLDEVEDAKTRLEVIMSSRGLRRAHGFLGPTRGTWAHPRPGTRASAASIARFRALRDAA
jgi:hypothetical protein